MAKAIACDISGVPNDPVYRAVAVLRQLGDMPPKWLMTLGWLSDAVIAIEDRALAAKILRHVTNIADQIHDFQHDMQKSLIHYEEIAKRRAR